MICRILLIVITFMIAIAILFSEMAIWAKVLLVFIVVIAMICIYAFLKRLIWQLTHQLPELFFMIKFSHDMPRDDYVASLEEAFGILLKVRTGEKFHSEYFRMQMRIHMQLQDLKYTDDYKTDLVNQSFDYLTMLERVDEISHAISMLHSLYEAAANRWPPNRYPLATATYKQRLTELQSSTQNVTLKHIAQSSILRK